MDKQEVWDRQLLRGWNSDSSIAQVAAAFLVEVKPELVDAPLIINNWEKFREFFVPLGLKRCLDVNSAGEPIFLGWGRTRVFIASRCERLNNCLWSGKHTEQKLLDSIDAFTWRKHGKAIQQVMGKKQRRKMLARSEVNIKARGLSNRDWNTVK
jgi:hypothetical protein